MTTPSSTPRSLFFKRKLRHYLAWPFAFALAMVAKSSDTGFVAGIPVIVLGEAIRIWSSGHLLKARQLVTDGPYAFVRHPLYVGNFLIGLGFSVIIWHPLIVLFFVIGFFAVYRVTIGLEEDKLRDRFEPSFQSYAEHVHPFIPRFAPYPYRSRDPFVWQRVWDHGEHIAILAITVLILAIHVRQEFYQEHRPIHQWMSSLVWTVMLGAILAFFQWKRRSEKKGQ